VGFGIAQDIVDNTASFAPGNDMFHEDTDTGHDLILCLSFSTEGVISGLFLRLIGGNLLRFKPLEARLFKEDTARRKGVVFFITNAFVVDGPAYVPLRERTRRSSISTIRVFFTVWSFFYRYTALFAQ
jgi:hypothetical protein